MKSFRKRSQNWRNNSELSTVNRNIGLKTAKEEKEKLFNEAKENEEKVEEAISLPESHTEKLSKKKKNKSEKKNKMNSSVLNEAENIANSLNNVQKKVKVVKSDKGLIERTESSKIVLTEDNRQVLND